MNLILERSELAILVLHLNIMRKPVKKGFKSNYGPFEGRKKLKVYDEIKERFQDNLSEEIDPVLIDLDEQELIMMKSFINWYVLEIKLSAEAKGTNIEHEEQIMILESINKKVNKLAELMLQGVMN